MTKIDPYQIHETHHYQVYRYRYVISALFCASSAVSAIMWICYSPIETIMSNTYNESLSYIAFCTSLIWLVVYPPINFIANYILDVYGLKAGVLIGNALALTGLWIRTLCQTQDQFYLIFIGQFLGGLGQPFILNSPQKVSAVWYPPEERTFSTAILSVANPVGVGIGVSLSQVFVSNQPTVTEGLNEIHNLSLFHAILGTCLLAPSFFLFRAKPPTPPSKGAETEKFGYVASLKSLIGNKNYLTFLGASCMLYGAFNVVSVILEPVIAPFGFTSSDAGSYGGLALLFGLIGTLVIGSRVNKNKKLKSTILICSYISTGSLVSLMVLAFCENAILFGIAAAIYGFFTTALLPLYFEMIVEISFPVNEASSGGLFLALTQIVAVAASEIITHILEIDNKVDVEGKMLSVTGISILVVMTLIGTALTILAHENLRRSDFERTGKFTDNCEKKQDSLLGEETFGDLSKVQE